MKADVNVVRIHDNEYLLVEGGGERVHLAAASEVPAHGRPAVDHHQLEISPWSAKTLQHYDRAALLAPRWADRALCGHRWGIMAAGEGGPILKFQETALAPTCRSCLRSIDRLFPDAKPDPRLGSVVRRAVQTVLRYGSVQVAGVPGPQQPLLRSAARRELQACGLDARTAAHDTLVLIWSEQAHEEMPPDARQEIEDRLHSVVAAISVTPDDRTSPDPSTPVWHLQWSRFKPDS